MIIDCESCALFDPSLSDNPSCRDCVVSVIISIDTLSATSKKSKLESASTPQTNPDINVETEEALALLSSRGLVPPLRFNPVNFG
jgi:hypothetical protein